MEDWHAAHPNLVGYIYGVLLTMGITRYGGGIDGSGMLLIVDLIRSVAETWE